MPTSINDTNEWNIIRACEKYTHTDISAKQRLIQLSKLLPSYPQPKNILDVGGNLGTARWLQLKFPKSDITVLNNSKAEIKKFRRAIFADAQNFQTTSPYDLIFCGETIEHVYNPDGLLYSCFRSLAHKGLFILTTPNMACIYNRLFLLMGYTPGNYSPSLRYNTGNPFMNLKTDAFGMIGDHKTVFTYKGLYELLEIHGFTVLTMKGYSYSQKEPLLALGKQHYTIPLANIRLVLNTLIPDTLREGMVFIAQKNRLTDPVKQPILKKNIWTL